MRPAARRSLVLTLAFVAAPTAAFAHPTVVGKNVLRAELAPTDFSSLNTGHIGGPRGFYVKKEGGADPAIGVGFGLSYGVGRDAELGLLVLPLHLAPTEGFADMTAHMRYRVHDSDYEVAVQLALRLPTDTGFGAGFGAPIVFHLGRLEIEGGPELEFEFDGTTRAHLDLPAAFLYEITSAIYVGIRSALFLEKFESMSIPIGAVGGATIAASRSVRIEAIASFLFDDFITSKGGPIELTHWTLNVGANVHFQL